MSKRPAKPHRFQIPTRDDVAMRLRALIDESVPRAEVADWAIEYFLYDDPQIFPKVMDRRVWRALDKLTAADMPSTDRPFLYEEVDFRNWLRELGEPDGELG